MVSPDKNAKNITVSETSSADHTSTTHLNPTRGLAASHAPELHSLSRIGDCRPK